MNSPDKTLLVNKLLVGGSKDSVFPKIEEVLAVGMGATNNEFLIPCSTI